jgi:hypothetical protein
VVAHAFNPSTWEAEAGGFLSLRSVWSTEWVPGLYREILSGKNKQTKNKQKKKKKKERKDSRLRVRQLAGQSQVHLWNLLAFIGQLWIWSFGLSPSILKFNISSAHAVARGQGGRRTGRKGEGSGRREAPEACGTGRGSKERGLN